MNFECKVFRLLAIRFGFGFCLCVSLELNLLKEEE